MTKAEKKFCIKECKLIQIKLFAADSIVQGRFEFLTIKTQQPSFCTTSITVTQI